MFKCEAGLRFTRYFSAVGIWTAAVRRLYIQLYTALGPVLGRFVATYFATKDSILGGAVSKINRDKWLAPRGMAKQWHDIT